MNILLSSYDFHEYWAENEVKKHLYPGMKVTVIPFSFDEKEVKNKEDFDRHYGENGIHTPWIYRPFLHYGIKKEDIVFVDYFRDSHEIALKKVTDADVLFLTGGLPDQYLQRLQEFKLVSEIKSGNYHVIGASAGAMLQFDTFHITPDDDYPMYHYQKGLGLVSGIEIECHYCNSEIQNQGIQRVIKERHLPTYAMANDGGIIIDKGIIQVIGNCYLVNP